MFGPRAEHFQTLFVRAPLQDIDIDITHAPSLHLETGRLVKIDRVRPNQGRTIIVDHVFFLCIDNAKARAQREARPIGRCTHNVTAGEITAESIVAPAAFGSRVSSGPHLPHTTQIAVGRGHLANYGLLLRTTGEETRCSQYDYKFKIFQHLQHSGLNTIDVLPGKRFLRLVNLISLRASTLLDSRCLAKMP